MAIEIFAPLAELIGNIGIAIRGRRERSEARTVSVPVACLSYLLVGLVAGVLGIGFLMVFSALVVFLSGSTLLALLLSLAWRAGTTDLVVIYCTLWGVLLPKLCGCALCSQRALTIRSC